MVRNPMHGRKQFHAVGRLEAINQGLKPLQTRIERCFPGSFNKRIRLGQRIRSGLNL